MIAGANESVFNDSFTITSVPSSTTFTFSLTTNTAQATGTLTCCIAPLGWQRAYSGTNKAVFQSTDLTSTKCLLRCDDTLTRSMKWTMFESMQDIDNGINGTTNNPSYVAKSNGADASPRPWMIVGDTKRFWFLSSYLYNQQCSSISFFGDITPLKAGDRWHCCIAGTPTEQCDSPTAYWSIFQGCNHMFLPGANVARPVNQVGSYSQISAWTAAHIYNNTDRLIGCSYGAIIPMRFPSVANNSVNLEVVESVENVLGGYIRGTWTGLYAPREQTNGYFMTGDRTLNWQGRNFLAIRTYHSTFGYGNMFIDTTGPWG